MSKPDPHGPTTEILFATWLESYESTEQVDFEDLCAEHPEHEPHLREFHRRWELLDAAMASLKRTPGLSEAQNDVVARLVRKAGSGRYHVQDEIARGGMGRVLRVWDDELRRVLAMKVMRTIGAGRSEPTTGSNREIETDVDVRLLARFLDEAQITGQLDHPGIVPVHEMGLDAKGRVYFTMKLVQGQTLRAVFEECGRGEDGWTQARALRLLQRVCEAMSYAHAKGVIHRDLKPDNVMVGRYGEVYVMDWGLAKSIDRDDDRDIRPSGAMPTDAASDRAATNGNAHDSPLFTMEGEVIGTPAYMPPEQARGDLAAMGPHSDVYAVGAMLYHLLAGHMPYASPGERASSRLIWNRVLEGGPRPLGAVARGAPPDLVALCEKAMSRDVNLRYPDMSALSKDLSAYLDGRVVAAYETGAWAEARKWVRRNRRLASALALTIVAVVAGSIAFAVKAGEAARRNEDVFRLSALHDANDLLDRAGDAEHWPPHPDRIPALEDWIRSAEHLVVRIPEFEAKRDALRSSALEPTIEEREAERVEHPDYPALVRSEARLRALRDARDRRGSGRATEWNPIRLDADAIPANPRSLLYQASRRVRPDRTLFGREAEGLALAQRALELAQADSSLAAAAEAMIAQAFFALGLDGDARLAAGRVLELAPASEWTKYASWRERLDVEIQRARSPDGLRAADDRIASLDEEVEGLATRVDSRSRWRFPDSQPETRWWHEQLTELIERLRIVRALLADDAVVTAHGWTVPKRLAFARELEGALSPGGDLRRSWSEALPAIRAAYAELAPDLALEAQVGLAPLGPDPDSGLWEFAHLPSGVPVERDADGRLVLTDESGLVLVLLPGGTFRMGSQSTDPNAPHYYEFGRPWEAPVHEVHVSPFFLSKYEMTRAQWSRMTGQDPSVDFVLGHEPTLEPVQSITWRECTTWLPRAGLVLPSEARWEYAARAGTDTPWFTGSERGSVAEQHAANLGDETAASMGVFQPDVFHDPDPADGFAFVAPIGSFTPNAFGLHDVLGNVSEFCLDGFAERFHEDSPWLDPVAPWRDAPTIFSRGGAWYSNAVNARASIRFNRLPDSPNSGIGVRPARDIDAR